MMKIGDLRCVTKMSQRKFAEHFGIPVGTLRNWEQGIASPPDYVFQMIFTSMRRDKMINIETIKFVKMLDELAHLSINGVEPFENATENSLGDKVFYDNKKLENEEGYRIVLDACIVDDPQCYHHDIISYYDEHSLEYKIRAMMDEDSAYIIVKLLISEDIIIIENGTWYFA
jgi:transcriptional regulator with XRE-family HTH domain